MSGFPLNIAFVKKVLPHVVGGGNILVKLADAECSSLIRRSEYTPHSLKNVLRCGWSAWEDAILSERYGSAAGMIEAW